ncbi:MAG: DUF308 domain-containing protein [Victivallaceae bacterium]|nr:DUF308 domain-containing protein [Victivallaceae bacterium]
MEENAKKHLFRSFVAYSRKMLIFRGVLLILLGILVFSNLPKILQFVTMIAGILLLVDGIFNLAGIFAERKYTLPGILSAAVLIVFGIVLLKRPLVFDTFLLMFIGAWILFNGIQEVLFGFGTGNVPASMLSGILSCIVGGIFFATPWLGLASYGWAVGTLLCLSGISTALTGFFLNEKKIGQ